MLTKYHALDKIGFSLFRLAYPYENINFYYRPPQWHKSPHKHDFYQFLLVIEGELNIQAGNEEVFLKRGMASVIPPGHIHSLKTEAGYKQFGINMASGNALEPGTDDGMMRLLSASISAPLILNMPGFLDFLPEIEDCSWPQTALSIQKIRNRLEYIFLTCIEALQKRDGNQAFREKLMNYFKGNISANISLEEISKSFFMSISHIERLSYKEFGCGAIRLFHRLKMDRARMLLQNTNYTISDISSHLGYEDQGYFSRIFKKHEGISPSKYQKQQA